MYSESQTHLKTDTVEKLQTLLQYMRDSEAGFKRAADVVEDGGMERVFEGYATQRSHFVRELSRFISQSGQTPEHSGSFKGRFHRWWLGVRAALTSDDIENVLVEACRGEDALISIYEEIILETTGNPVNDTLHRQYRDIVQSRKRLDEMRTRH